MTMKSTFRERIRMWRWPILAGLITLVGAILRIALAWAMRFPAGNGDFSIISLMAKHMAEGSDFPVFAYPRSGRAYCRKGCRFP